MFRIALFMDFASIYECGRGIVFVFQCPQVSVAVIYKKAPRINQKGMSQGAVGKTTSQILSVGGHFLCFIIMTSWLLEM